MKLNEHDKNDLRKKIEEAVKRVPDGQRIELPLEVLDELIFLKVNDKEGVTVKFPVWTGEFLRKIDLSKLSFENVHWGVAIYDYNRFDLDKLSRFHKDSFTYIVPFVGRSVNSTMDSFLVKYVERLIDFSYTNINPDLSNVDKIESTNFEGVDLSHSNLNLKTVVNCNLKNTGAKLDKIIFNDIESIKYTNLTNCTFMFFSLDFNVFLKKIDMNNLNNFPILINTGLKITFNKEYANDDVKELVKALCLSGKLDGCYLNGRLIDSSRVIQNKSDKQALLDEYINLKNQIYESTLGSIEEQIKGFKEK